MTNAINILEIQKYKNNEHFVPITNSYYLNTICHVHCAYYVYSKIV